MVINGDQWWTMDINDLMVISVNYWGIIPMIFPLSQHFITKIQATKLRSYAALGARASPAAGDLKAAWNQSHDLLVKIGWGAGIWYTIGIII